MTWRKYRGKPREQVEEGNSRNSKFKGAQWQAGQSPVGGGENFSFYSE